MDLLKTERRLLDNKALGLIYLAITLFAFLQILHSDGGNNFLVFRSSFFHLTHQLPLYIPYPNEYNDLFLYHPLFPVLFSPIAVLPPTAGMLLWLLFSSFLSFYAVDRLPISDKEKSLVLILLIFPLLNNLQNCQSNIVLLSCMLLAYSHVQRKNIVLASLFIVISFLIKGYGGGIGFIILFERNKLKFILSGLIWLVLFHLLALLFIPFDILLQYYSDWLRLITGSEIRENFSLYGALSAVGLKEISEIYILSLSVFLLLTFLAIQYFKQKINKLTICAFLLIWMVVFNRAAESATYIIAFAGVMLWYVSHPTSQARTLLFGVTIILSFIFPTNVILFLDKLRYEYYLSVYLHLFVLADIYLFSITQLPKRTNPKNVFI